MYDILEAEGCRYTIRLPANAVLYRKIAHLMKRPVGRPPAKAIIDFYNGRDRAEQAIKEGKVALNWTRLSCHDFVDNQVRRQLFALAYNLSNLLRSMALPAYVRHWTLTTLLVKLIKTGAKVAHHARYVIFQKAELWVSTNLRAAILARIRRWAANARAGTV